METKLRSDLEALFAPQAVPAQALRPTQIAMEDTEEAFLQAFYVQQAAVFLPAFAEIGEYIRAKGCDYRIDSHQAASTADGRQESAQVTLRFLIGATPSHTQDYEYPHFKAMCDSAARKVIFHQSTIYPGHSGTSGTVGQVRLEDVSVASLQEKLGEFVRALFAK